MIFTAHLCRWPLCSLVGTCTTASRASGALVLIFFLPKMTIALPFLLTLTNKIHMLGADNTSWKIDLISCHTYICPSYFHGSGTPVASVTTWPTCLARWCSWTTWAPSSTPPPSRSSWRSPSWWSTLKAAGCWRRGSASSPASSSPSSSSSSSSSSPPSFSPGDVRRWE